MERAVRVCAPNDLWELERWLTQRRPEIDRTYDYRYSVLPLVFRNLVREGRLREPATKEQQEDSVRQQNSPTQAKTGLEWTKGPSG